MVLVDVALRLLVARGELQSEIGSDLEASLRASLDESTFLEEHRKDSLVTEQAGPQQRRSRRLQGLLPDGGGQVRKLR